MCARLTGGRGGRRVGSPVPFGGTVSFNYAGADAGALVGTCNAQPVDTSTGKATCTVTIYNPDTYAIAATYSGYVLYLPSTSAVLDQTVKWTTKTAITSSVNPSAAVESVTITATVSEESPGTGTPTGTVTFIANGDSWAVVLQDGKATFTFSKGLPAGFTTKVTADYGGGSGFLPSSASLLQAVNLPA